MNLKLVCYFICCCVYCVESFSWQSCGDKNDPIKVTSLDIYSNKTNFLYVSGTGKTGVNLTAPVQAKLEMSKKFFWGWTLIPCVEQVGSCTYPDICTLSPYIDKGCPQAFVNNNLPCQCPILQGQYAAKRFPIDLKLFPRWIESGRYRIKLILQKDNKELICLIMNITL